MKHTKMFFALLVLAAAILAVGCNQPNTPSGGNTDNGGSSSGFTMNAAQEAAQTAFSAAGFKVEDKTPNQDIKKGTKADALKNRFVASKVEGNNNGGNNGGNGGNTGGGSSSGSVPAAIEHVYNGFITGLVTNAAMTDVPSAAFQPLLGALNGQLSAQGYNITDTQNGAQINQGATAEQLKQRFKLEKK